MDFLSHSHTVLHRRRRIYDISPYIKHKQQAKHGNRWAAVADGMPGRTGQQCAQRWRHKVNPEIRKDKWSKEEDAQVRAHTSRAPTPPHFFS